MSFPFWLEGSDVNDDTASGIGRFAEADRQDISRDTEVFDRARQRERVWRDDADIGIDIDKTFVVEIFRIDDSRIDQCQEF